VIRPQRYQFGTSAVLAEKEVTLISNVLNVPWFASPYSLKLLDPRDWILAIIAADKLKWSNFHNYAYSTSKSWQPFMKPFPDGAPHYIY
jgi:hypothetical protein